MNWANGYAFLFADEDDGLVSSTYLSVHLLVAIPFFCDIYLCEQKDESREWSLCTQKYNARSL